MDMDLFIFHMDLFIININEELCSFFMVMAKHVVIKQ